jgi:hypothetical protein
MGAVVGGAVSSAMIGVLIGLDYIAVAPDLTNQFRVLFAIVCLAATFPVGAVVGWLLAPRAVSRSTPASGLSAALLGGALGAVEVSLVLVVSVLGTPRIDPTGLAGFAALITATALLAFFPILVVSLPVGLLWALVFKTLVDRSDRRRIVQSNHV